MRSSEISSLTSVLFYCILQPVILKELKQTDGDFTEDQRIELNTVRLYWVSVLIF